MRYIVVLGDGMSDYPVAGLGGRTPLQAAQKPGMDYIARNGEIGLTYTVPAAVSPGSDTANLSVMGFDPTVYYTGRAPIEAVSMGVPIGDGDIAYRCNLVSLSGGGRYEDKIMEDYSSGEITSEEAAELINDVNSRLLGRVGINLREGAEKGVAKSNEAASRADGNRLGGLSGAGMRTLDNILFYPGISYRHCMVWKDNSGAVECTPPHDILTQPIGEYLPVNCCNYANKGAVAGGCVTAGGRAEKAGGGVAGGSAEKAGGGAAGGRAEKTGGGIAGGRVEMAGGGAAGGDAELLRSLMRESYDFLSSHEINRSRVRRGLPPANSLWLWGQGKRLSLSSFFDKYGKKGAVISAVDLLKGIAISAGMQSIDVEGATGTLDTDYGAKARAALAALDGGCDFVYIHVEAPDECGHRNEAENKVKSIEFIDEKIVVYLINEFERRKERFAMMVLPDHATPLSLRTHTRDPIPFAIYASPPDKYGAGTGKGQSGADGNERNEFIGGIVDEKAVVNDVVENAASAEIGNSAAMQPKKGEAVKSKSGGAYDESEAAKTGFVINSGHELMGYFLGKK